MSTKTLGWLVGALDGNMLFQQSQLSQLSQLLKDFSNRIRKGCSEVFPDGKAQGISLGAPLQFQGKLGPF